MDTKALARVEIKDADRGEVVAAFAKFDVIDHDGDVTVKGAFTDGAPVRISAYGHASWGGALPVGKGIIREVGDEAVMEGQFFMNTTHGRDHFETVKALGEAGLQEWSYGYDVDGPDGYSFGDHDGQHVRFLKKMKVHEVSPVLLGAGIGTRVLSTKSLKFSEEADAVLAAVASLTTRTADVMAMRAEKGKGLSPESSGLLGRVQAEMKRLADLLDAEPAPTPPEMDDDAVREYLRMVARTIA
ncbi:HK97 family phage prohead protease [Nocardiopsis dassonvillei]|uniref:HK97 family phage prohead protease n=1 Tax=Nocardiopsis dassonvillei TaxID=2014 RepID=UPI0036FC949C